MASNPPGAFAQQQRIIQSRFPPAAAAPSYDAWNDVWNDDQSESSWSTVTAEQGEGADQTSGHNKMDPIPEAGSFVPPTRDVPPPPATPNVWSQPQAPAMQAARNFVDHTNEPPASRRLRRQQENASRNGRRGVRYVQLGAHNAVNIELPNHVQQVGSKQGERSILVLDHRDQRLQSPFQGWLLDEILTNAAARINILSDSRLVRSPTTGYHCNLFLIKTLANVKVVFAGCMTSYESVTCGKWDSETAKVLSHPAFQPFRWPLMFNDSPTWVDVKVKLEGILLIHLELRGYRSDRDMTVQLNSVTDALLEILNDLSRVEGGVLFMGSRRSPLCSFGRRSGGLLGLPTLSCRAPSDSHILSRCNGLGRRSRGVQILERLRSVGCFVQWMLSPPDVVGGQPCFRPHSDQECGVVQEEIRSYRRTRSDAAAFPARFSPCSLDCSH